MSKPIAPPPAVTPHVNPLANQQAVNSPNSTAQTDAQLTTTSKTRSDAFEPTLSSKGVPKSPLDTATDSTASTGSVMEHSAPVARDQSLDTVQALRRPMQKHKSNIKTQLMYLKMRLYQVMSKRNSIWVSNECRLGYF